MAMAIDTKTLKAGDEVAVWRAGREVYPRYTVAVVKSITPTGRVRLVDGRQFNADGAKMGGGNKMYGEDRLYGLDDSLTKFIADEPHLKIIHGFVGHPFNSPWPTLPTEALRQIAAIIAANADKEPAAHDDH